MDPITATTETAKAVGEVAKAAGKVIDGAREMGRFIARYVHGPLAQGVGIFEDKLAYSRWERQVRLMQRAEQFLAEQGLKVPPNGIPLKFAVPLLQAATLEDDDYLQDLWARLLVNAAVNPDIASKRAFISILENMSGQDVQILLTLCAAETGDGAAITTYEVPDRAFPWNPEADGGRLPQPSDEILFSLGNLARLGTLSGLSTAGGGVTYGAVHVSVLGRRLVQACTAQPTEVGPAI
ncbi:Abi-alpha family protein [Caballeronia sordidicola]|uniref:Abi-alpha family protein n=1 Tax=Caballeronia sordidicola TaxID=196367 RepID=UPI0011783A3C|nr:Abi-alpha family protein [Caballeronia sordidicola]